MMRERKLIADLRGWRILVIEDDFYLASDMSEAIERAGGIVLGPCPDVPAALAQLDTRPDCAVVDINLGEGPSFAIAGALQERSIPFLFLTGYDTAVILTKFSHIACLQKPAETSRVINAIAGLIRP